MMSGSSNAAVLGRRLERLTGEDGDCCLPEYRALGKRTARSRRFAESLRRVRALADEHRLLAVSLLKDRRELCACEIQAATGLTHATVSHHMRVLTEAGLVSATRRGKWMFYRLRDPKWSGIA
jgi:ArsR family transcriptional regulator, arsenate/arsenite/antimonite-responsive transcriptional repressor